MHEHERYRLNSPHVVAEAIEASAAGQAEAIVVNLDTGTYYSISGDSILVWSAIVEGTSIAELAEAVAAATAAPAERARQTLGAFRDALVAQGLIVEREDEAQTPPPDLSAAGAGLLEPSFSSYSDMQDLILLDPVHEVDEQGWPNAQPV